MEDFTKKDSILNGSDVCFTNQVLRLQKREQMVFCLKDDGDTLHTVSLMDGEVYLCQKREVIDVLKPERLSNMEKLQLSQIRPFGALDVSKHSPKYSGYGFLSDGRHASGVWLCSIEEVRDYIQMQKDYQHRVLICDRDDFIVMEFIEGQQVFPKEQTRQETLNGQVNGEFMILG